MKLNKIKIARLTNDQAKSIKGGIEGEVVTPSTEHRFTCRWCTGGGIVADSGETMQL